MTPDPDLTGRLIDLSRNIASGRGWTWREPIEITAETEQGEAVWVVRTNVLMRSPSVRIVLRRSDLSVVIAGYLPR
jgi:hypothetical protein